MPCARAPRQPPVKAGIVDEHKGVRPLFLKDALRQAEDAPEFRHVDEDAKNTDEGQIAQRIGQSTAGRSHALAAEAVDFQVRLALPQSVDEVGAVEIAAGFARADEQSHEEHPAVGERVRMTETAIQHHGRLPGERRLGQARQRRGGDF